MNGPRAAESPRISGGMKRPTPLWPGWRRGSTLRSTSNSRESCRNGCSDFYK